MFRSLYIYSNPKAKLRSLLKIGLKILLKITRLRLKITRIRLKIAYPDYLVFRTYTRFKGNLESRYVVICNKEGTLYKNAYTGKKRSKSFPTSLLDTASKNTSKNTSKNNTAFRLKVRGGR